MLAPFNGVDLAHGHSFVCTLIQLLPDSNGWVFGKAWTDQSPQKAWLNEGAKTELKLEEKNVWWYWELLEESLNSSISLPPTGWASDTATRASHPSLSPQKVPLPAAAIET
ncbi:hypothetical protein CDV36_011392 [Fusarium kuroshium]|uniref:Uncharacterized protein n=1 Tax=Fusarium kuroshium TaxID=2010991 RepID=A0A3M2RUN5_9HYPO|nr:hypothetical protein CDV36_011392 [Fusarium kuroshium]